MFLCSLFTENMQDRMLDITIFDQDAPFWSTRISISDEQLYVDPNDAHRKIHEAVELCAAGVTLHTKEFGFGHYEEYAWENIEEER